jgi:hypothetical protein
MIALVQKRYIFAALAATALLVVPPSHRFGSSSLAGVQRAYDQD